VISLRAQTLFRIRLDGERVLYAEPIPLDHRLRDIVMLPDQTIAIVTDEKQLMLLRDPMVASPKDDFNQPLKIAGYDAERKLEAPQDKLTESWARTLYADRCGACHSMDGTPNVGPSLAGIIGRPIGKYPNFSYSAALSGA